MFKVASGIHLGFLTKLRLANFSAKFPKKNAAIAVWNAGYAITAEVVL
jgi:hypothetical protein